MPVNLSIKNVPDDLARRLRRRAARSHRSIQGELLAILEEALAPGERMTASQVLDHVRGLGVKTGAEAKTIIRSERDAR